jgi:ABC-type sugar transport system ATPase subunit
MPVIAAKKELNGAQRLILGVRPEDVSLEGGQHAASIELVEDMGPAKVAVVSWGGERVHILLDKHSPKRPKDKVFPCVNPERVVLWPTD